MPYTAMGRHRLDHLERCLDDVRDHDVPGDLVECGTGRGGGAVLMRAHLDAHEIDSPTVWVVDRFRASPGSEPAPSIGPGGVADLRADLNMVRDAFDRFDLLDDRVRFLLGPPQETIPGSPIEQVSLLRIGRSAADDVGAILTAFHPRLAAGSHVIVELDDDGTAQGAVDGFRAEHGVAAPLERIDRGCIAWRSDRTGDANGIVDVNGTVPTAAGAPVPRSTPGDAIDLTVIVVFYNMRREAARTLHALSRAYQLDLDDVAYEVLAIENGSDPDQRLGTEFVESFGPEFRYVDMGPEAPPSPVTALNRGIELARGANVALMIDGAHVVTPRVLRHGLTGLRAYAPALVATQQWYVGPGQQGDAMDDGYDTEYEDRLFDTIEWPHDGYRLFEIGHFVGDRDWLDGLWESNCIFVPRSLLEQSGGFDESFAMPGGGYANLELYERLGSSPGVTVTTILGEGSFHQIHGGTTTNQTDADERRARVFGYGAHYAEQRGKPFRGPGKPIHYVGSMPSPSMRRTKSRRRTGEAFLETSALIQGDGPALHPMPMPDELAVTFTEAIWRTVPWDHTSWLGRRVRSAPTDLLAYQEIVTEVRPDWIIEVGSGDPGRTLYLASICDLMDHGRVLTVDERTADDRPQHPRVDTMSANTHSRAAAERVAAVVGDGRAMVVLGSLADRQRTEAQFRNFAPLVPVGSYVVIADTIVNGNPVWPAFGPGPAEAVKSILSKNGDFVADPLKEKYALTFNPSGFLKRVA